MNNTLTIMVGLPRSGKSIWIEKYKGDAVVISNDWIRENILGTHYAPAANSVIWTMVDTVLRVVLGQGKDVVLDGINHTKFVRKFYIDVAKEYGATVKIVVVDTPLNVCLARNNMKFTHKLPKETLISIHDKFEKPTSEESTYIEYYDAVCKHEFVLKSIYHDSGYFIDGSCTKCKLNINDCGLELSESDLWTMYREQEEDQRKFKFNET